MVVLKIGDGTQFVEINSLEVNNLEGDGALNILDHEVPIGTGAGTVAYLVLPTSGATVLAVAFDGAAFSQATLVSLSDVTATTGSGTTVVLGTGPTLTGATLNGAQDASGATSFKVPSFAGATPIVDGLIAYDTTAKTLTYGDDSQNRIVVNTNEVQTLSGKRFVLLGLQDTSETHRYFFGVNELAADRTVTLPLLLGNDIFVFEAFAQTLTNKTINGATLGGVTDAGSATSFEVPNGAGGTTVDAAGEVTVDTTSGTRGTGTFNFHEGAERVLSPVLSKGVVIEDPTASEDMGFLPFTNVAITIIEMRAVLVGSDTPSVTWTFRHGTDRSAAGAEVVTGGTVTTSTSTGSDVTSFNDATIVADSFGWIETTAQSGTVNILEVTVFYTEDA